MPNRAASSHMPMAPLLAVVVGLAPRPSQVEYGTVV